MSFLALMLGWLLARTIRIVPASSDAPPPPPPPPAPTGPADVPFGPGGIRRRPASPRATRRPTSPAAPTTPIVQPGTPIPATSSPPWPQVMPSGLSPFPSGWEPYNPPPGAVVQRANELLPQLWRGGSGTFKVEKTGGVWVYYRATPMGEKKGVVAFREKVPSAAAAPTSNASTTPTVTPIRAASASPVALPTLRKGSRGEDVRILQQRLGIPADGAFGPQTEAAVRAYQGRNGLTVDGVVGPQTWSALMARAA